ncbi:hypothetical protein PR048_018418 [Dryococelus australis]|uniref:Uncharacterized protein n=1 Tax=Dryococelus australis TaxID=614101 RepID=A0ABQ9HCL6_9NEOP|nr:hypothetical protein PR048_018418 [Dryococelus australis]
MQYEQVNKLQDQQTVSKQPAPAADAGSFVEVRRRGTKTPTVSGSSPSKQAAAVKQIQLGVRNNVNIKTVPKQAQPRLKAMFVFRFASEVEEKEMVSYINQELKVSNLKVAKLKTMYDTYSSFYVAVAESDF